MTSLTVALGPGLGLVLRGLQGSLLEPIASYFAYFVEGGAPAEGTAEPLVIELEPGPAADGAEPVAAREGLRVAARGALLFFELPGARGWCDVAAGRGGIALASDDAQTRGRVVTQLLTPLLFELAAGRGWVGLHAAAVAVDGQGILLPGESGCGKSTVFQASRAQGIPVLSDDLVWLRPGGDGELLLHPFPRGAPFSLTGGPDLVATALRRVVFPARASAPPSRLVALGSEESLALLAAQAGMLCADPAQAERFRLLVRAARLPACRLEMADGDLDGAPALLTRLLAGESAAWAIGTSAKR